MSKGAVASVFALALAFPAVAATNASADPNIDRVVLAGQADCSKFGANFAPTSVSASGGGVSNSRVINSAGQPSASYSQLVLSPVAAGPGVPASATLTCTNSQTGLERTIVQNFTLARPAGNTVVANVDIF